MIKTLFNKSNFIAISVSAVLCGILISCIHLIYFGEATFEAAFLCARDGTIDLGDGQFHVDLFICFLNCVTTLPFIIRLFSDDFDIYKAYLFVRHKGKNKWFSYKLFQCYFYCLYSAALYNGVIMIVTKLFGYQVENNITAAGYYLFAVWASFIILAFAAMLGNIMTLFFKPVLVNTVVMLLTGMSLGVTIIMTRREHIQFNLLSNFFISWHIMMSQYEDMYSLPTFAYYLIIILIMLFAVIAGKKAFNKADLL